jgi:hypothetical protein
MQIVDACIKLLKVHDSLIKRPGGTVYLESACIAATMKRDGKKDETIEANYRGIEMERNLFMDLMTYERN